MVAAKKMAAGGILYQDFMDNRQPGIFIFFYLAGKLFGFNEVGVHIFELIYWLIFSVILIKIFRKFQYFDNQFIADLLPLFIVCVYYCNTAPWHLTQVEALVNFPILLLIWTLIESEKSD